MKCCVSSLVLFMDRTESTEEQPNDGQVIIARSHVQTGVACIIFEVGTGPAEQEDARALGVAVLAGQVQSCVPRLGNRQREGRTR